WKIPMRSRRIGKAGDSAAATTIPGNGSPGRPRGRDRGDRLLPLPALSGTVPGKNSVRESRCLSASWAISLVVSGPRLLVLHRKYEIKVEEPDALAAVLFLPPHSECEVG